MNIKEVNNELNKYNLSRNEKIAIATYFKNNLKSINEEYTEKTKKVDDAFSVAKTKYEIEKQELFDKIILAHLTKAADFNNVTLIKDDTSKKRASRKSIESNASVISDTEENITEK